MATGTGKTRTAIALMFRLIQSQRFKRVLFLVDRRSLGEQALGSFEDTRINGDTFNSIFDIKGLTDKFPEDSTKIHVATVQSLVKRTLQSDEPMPVGRYDCIVVDEAHRGYILDKEQTEGELQFRSQLDYISAYRRILDHFDALKIALTATPALHTVDIFGEPVYRYTYRTAVIDGYLIDQDPPIQIVTRNAQDGVYLSEGEQVERLNTQGELINDTLADDQDFEVADFNRGLVIPAFNRAVCGELTKYLDPTGQQKTLVFCVTNAHADMVVDELRTAFKKKYPQLEHDAIIKITGDADKDAKKVQSMIVRFNKERLPNIVVTVDLLTTGVDIPSICNIVFLRKVKSRILYEQMKGRATRLCPSVGKTSFKIFDCVDIYSSLESVDTMRPVVVRPQVELQTLVNEITDSETYKTIEADGRSFAEHSHEQLVAKLQRIIGLATYNRDRSEAVDKQVRRLDELCMDAAGVNFGGLASRLREKGPHWSAAQALPDDLLPAPPEQAPEQTSTMLFWYWLYRGMAHFSCGEYADAQADLERAGWYAWSAPGHIHLLDYHFYSALALSRQLTPETFSADYRRSIHHHYDKIALWARINSGTFADKEALIYAEIVRLDGMNSIALEQYEKAVRLSREGGFNPINALAHELAGRFSLACGYPTASDAHFRGAIAAWGRAGAQAKVRQLEQDFPHLLASGQSRAYDTAAFAQNEVIRDLQSVIKASRALSEEINLERLIENLMTLLLERAGAQRGLLLRVSDNHIPEIEASAWTSTDGVRVRILKASPMATDMPLSVLAAVIRTGQEIRTGKPEEFHPFSQDPYLVTSGAAVMCVPMFKQARLVGVLYLENRLMPEVFTAEHSRVVSLLGAQAAVSLETARLYAELLAENIQRRRVEKELRASQTSLMLGEQISHTGSWRWELVQDLMFMSEEYARILGLPEQQKMISMAEFLTFVHEDDYGRISTLVNQSVRDGLSMRAEFRIIRTDGSVRYILGIGDPVGVGSEVNEYYGIITDITSQRAAEDAMRVAQADLARVSRATTVGQLTSSIAHEINQPLMSIVSNAGASLRWLNRDPARLDKVREGLEEIAAEGERAGEIIRSIQSLTRKQDPTFTRIDLHFLIHHIIMLSRSELELRHISVDYLLNADDSFIIGDSVQIQQVLLNLVMNAMEAMAEVTDRPCSITISTANCGEGKVIFEIADTGSGIEPELTERIFDSFYSTKAQGMGMGLTISASIIERHRGKLSARRREPYGTVFTFALPLAGQEE